MIRSPLGICLNPSRSIRDQIRAAARIGAKGVVIDAVGDIAPDRLSETGRREMRHLLRSVELSLIALHLPTRRSFDTIDQLEDRLKRAESAFTLAYELGTRLVLARVGALPPEAEALRRETWTSAISELGHRADHRGIRLAIETGTETGQDLRTILDQLRIVGLAASIDPAALLQHGFNPLTTTRDLGPWVAHAYATESSSPSSAIPTVRPRSVGFQSGVLDWEEYLGSLEEIDYRGFLTIWPDPNADAAAQFQSLKTHLEQF